MKARPGTALVTGASSGIGYELTRRLAREGWDLVLVARSVDRLEEIAAPLRREEGLTVTVIRKDLAQPGAADEVFDALRARSIDVRVLVNGAGFGVLGPFAETDPIADREMMQLNMVALTELTRRAVREMLPRRDGRILNVASTAAFQPGPNMAVYYASKAYVLSFTEALHHELKGSGIRVSCLCPGPTESEFSLVSGSKSPTLERIKVPAAPVVRAGLAGLDRNKAVVIPGLPNKLTAQINRIMPRAAMRRIVGNIKV
jgi:short-subunit dehydrogenase